MNYSPILIIVMLANFQLLLSGCESNDMSELHGYVDDVLARPGGNIEPVPNIRPYEGYTYKSAKEGQRDPFIPFYIDTAKDKKKQQWSGLTPEQIAEIDIRNKEELERFELDSLRMVGTLENEAQRWGLILDPEGPVHMVKPGNYLGHNVGKITNVYENRVELREIIQNTQGRWEERIASIALSEG